MTTISNHIFSSLLVLLLACLTLMSEETGSDDAAAQSTDQVAGDDGSVSPQADSMAAKVAYIHIDGEINALMSRYVERSLKQAKALGASTVVVHITSFGGGVFAAYEISQHLLKSDMRLLAFVNGEAISAGAMIAYSCNEIHLTHNSIIGDIGVVYQGGEGGVQFASEKIETFVRNYLDLIAQNRSWDRAIITKMCNRDQEIYQIRTVLDDPETWFYVLSDDLETKLADTGFKQDDNDHVVLTKWRKDKLITLPAADAVKYGMANSLVDSLDAFYDKHEINSATITVLTKTTTEEIADFLGGWAPMLAGLAVLFIVFEMKTPGVGLFAILGGTCGVAFLICQFYLDLAGNLELVLIAAGLALVAVEIFTAATGGILFGLGALLGLTGLLLAFMPNSQQFEFDANWWNIFGSALRSSSLTIFITVTGMLIILWRLPHMRAIKRIAVQGEIGGNSGGSIEAGSCGLIGQIGETTCSLHPGGQVLLDGRRWSASSITQSHIEAGRPVIVRAVRMGELVVEEHVEAPAADEGAAT